MSSVVHELKSWHEHFEAVVTGRKRFELRIDDGHNFRVGDQLRLREWMLPGYTGREQLVTVTHMLTAKDIRPLGIMWDKDVVCMSIEIPDDDPCAVRAVDGTVIA